MHAQREHNTRADWLATRGIQKKNNWSRLFEIPSFVAGGCLVRSFSDGGSRLGGGGAGYLIEVADKANFDSLQWHSIVETSLYIGQANSLGGEIVGSVQAFLACFMLCTHGRLVLDAQHYVQTTDIDWHKLVDIINSSNSVIQSECHEQASMLHIFRDSSVRAHCVL